MKVLVTGGAGFVGSHIVDEFIDAGHSVVIVDNIQSGDKTNINPSATLYECDICNDSLEDIFSNEKIDAVCHAAAKTNMRESLEDPVTDARINVIGLLNVLEACKKHNVSTFVFSSTGGALYGDTDVLPTTEDVPPKPISPYGITKMAGERYGFFYHNTHGMNVTVLRYSNIYGPRLERKAGVSSAVFRITQALQNEEQPEVRGNGEQTRDFVYVKDIARANRLAAENASGYAVYNTGSGVETSLNKLIDTIRDILNVSTEPEYTSEIAGEVKRSVLDVSKIKQELGWEPEYALKEGLREMLKH